MTDLFASYGPAVLTWMGAALAAALTALTGWLGLQARARAILQRGWIEVQGAVLEVSQTYADAIRAARADGTLTEVEKMEAKRLAISIAKANLGAKGLRRLGRVLGIDPDGWLASKTEQAVRVIKAADAALATVPVEAAPAGPR